MSEHDETTTSAGLRPLRPLTAADFTSADPAVTDLPMAMGENGEHYGFGHIDPDRFAAAAQATDVALGVMDVGDPESYDPGDVQHLWAVTTHEDGAEWRAEWVPEGTPGCWPITMLDYS